MRKVLIADDEEIECRYLTNLFEKHRSNYQLVGEAHNGKEIVELTDRMRPDIIIMDINMPLMNGLDSAYQIKKKFPEILILLNTAYAEFEFARLAIEYNLDAYLLKPASEEQILQTIEKCMKNERQRTSKHARYDKKILYQSRGTSNDAINQVTGYINERFQESLTLEELAALVHFSPSYLSKLFHQVTGLTIKNYLTLRRMEHARYLLKNSQLSIQEIAVNSGFPNVSHFNRVFRQQTGMSPLEFRHCS